MPEDTATLFKNIARTLECNLAQANILKTSLKTGASPFYFPLAGLGVESFA